MTIQTELRKYAGNIACFGSAIFFLYGLFIIIQKIKREESTKPYSLSKDAQFTLVSIAIITIAVALASCANLLWRDNPDQDKEPMKKLLTTEEGILNTTRIHNNSKESKAYGSIQTSSVFSKKLSNSQNCDGEKEIKIEMVSTSTHLI